MLGNTHFVTGIAAGLLLLQPASLPELIIGTGASAVGSVISDIDVGTSESHREADRIIAAACVIVAAVVSIEAIWHVGLYQRLMQNSNLVRILGGTAGFLLLCAFGKEQPHRSFMHSLLALCALSACVGIVFPLASPYFFVSFAAHLALDLLNRKREKLFWPLGKGICLKLCASDGLVNKILMRAGGIAVPALILFCLARIYFL